LRPPVSLDRLTHFFPFSLDSHLSAWIWSFVYATVLGYGAKKTLDNFTEMDYGKIEYLIAIAWTCVWARFIYVAVTRKELI